MLTQKTLAKSVSLALAAGSILSMTSANAAVQFESFYASRVVACDQAVAVGQTACGTAGANRFLVDFALRVSNSVTPAPDPAGAPEAVIVTTAALNDVFGVGNWTLVGTPAIEGDLIAPATAYTGTGSNLELARATAMAEGQAGSVAFTVEAAIAGSTFPGVSASVNTINRVAKVFVPLQPEGTVVGETCVAPYAPGTVEFVTNGGFTTPNGGTKTTSSASDLIANSFYSDVPLVFEGFNQYFDNKTISIQTGSLAGRYAQQQPLSTVKLNWLRHGGGESPGVDGTAQRFWKQRVSGLVVGRDYVISAYFTNISVPGQPRGSEAACGLSPVLDHDPRVQFLAGGVGVGNSPVTLEAETAVSGDSWRKIQGTFKATATEMELAIENSQLGYCYNQLGVTDISMKACLQAGENENTPITTPPTENPPVETTPTETTPTETSPTETSPTENPPTEAPVITGGGGGGGALGAGLLTLLGLGAMRRRRRGATR